MFSGCKKQIVCICAFTSTLQQATTCEYGWSVMFEELAGSCKPCLVDIPRSPLLLFRMIVPLQKGLELLSISPSILQHLRWWFSAHQNCNMPLRVLARSVRHLGAYHRDKQTPSVHASYRRSSSFELSQRSHDILEKALVPYHMAWPYHGI